MNWSNCPVYETCEDDKKDIMTYCDVQCSKKPVSKPSTDREAVARKLCELDGHIWGLTTIPFTPQKYLEKADQILSLQPKVLEELEELSSEFEADEVFGFAVRGKLRTWQATKEE